MAFQDNTRFWIIFDTCTRPEYYRDVHNLLALPYGSTISYDYRDKYLSLTAKTAASNPETAPSRILLIYAQWNQYRRGGDNPPRSTPSSEMLWVPTRLAEMQLIPPPEGGTNFFFDFKVLGYPKVDTTALMKILNPLIAAAEVPFHKWVCLSDDLQALASLQEGKSDDNWQSIVDHLGSPPMQFSPDSFMRLKGPFRGSKGRLLPPRYVKEKQTTDDRLEVRKIISLYDVYDGESFSIEVISHSPPPSDERAIESIGVQRRLEIKPEKEGFLSIPADTSLDLRQYTRQIVRIRATRSEDMDEKGEAIRFNLGVGADGWPMGADFLLRFNIQRKALKVLAALFLGVIGAVLLALTTKLWDLNPILGVSAAVIGILLVVITGLLLTGRLSFKL